MVVTDGGSGFASAVAQKWPTTKVQRCLCHVHRQVRQSTTSKPRLLAGQELYVLSKELMNIDNLKQAQFWIERFMQLILRLKMDQQNGVMEWSGMNSIMPLHIRSQFTSPDTHFVL